MKGKTTSSPLMLLLLILSGAVIGCAIWGLILPYLPESLAGSFSIGTTNEPWMLDLNFVKLSFGIVLNMNLGGIIGILLGLFFLLQVLSSGITNGITL